MPGYTKAVVSLEPSPMLLGVGYIIGPRIASVMVAGGITTALLIVPMISFFGDGLPAPLAPVQQKRIAEMEPGEIASTYGRYIGAGAVATGGVLSMLNALPLIIASVTGSLRDLGSGKQSIDRPVCPAPSAICQCSSFSWARSGSYWSSPRRT